MQLTLTYADIARRTKTPTKPALSRSCVSQLLRGTKGYSRDSLERVAKALDVSEADIFQHIDEKKGLKNE